MNDYDIISFLWEHGHFHNPSDPTGITLQDLPNLTLEDKEVRKAVRSYQEFLSDQLDYFSGLYHGRRAILDGEIGPATEELIKMPRCSCPDYEVEEATGSGSWPFGCHDKWPNNHSFTVQVDKSRMPSFLGKKDDPFSVFEQVWAAVKAAYAQIGLVLIREDTSGAQTHFQWENLQGGTIGLAILPKRPRCNDRIWCKYDPTYKPRNTFNQWCLLVAHELGHNLCLSHSRGGIMNPSIVQTQFTKSIWTNDPSYSILKQYFGGEPVETPGNPPPEEPDEPEGEVRLELTALRGEKVLKRVIL